MNKIIIPTIFLILLTTIIGVSTVYADEHEVTIPSWIKVVAGAWAEDKITDSEYQEAMKFLIESEVIIIPGYGKIIEVDIPVDVPIITDDKLAITTDKASYSGYETMIVSVELPNEYFDDIMLIIRGEDGNMYGMKSIQSNGSQEAEVLFTLDWNTFRNSGTYTIQCKYQGETVETTFEYTTRQMIGELTISLDKSSYNEGDIMHITGTVPDYKYSSVYISIVWPDGRVSEGIEYIQVQENFTYSIDIELHGQMNGIGDYTLLANYYGETVQVDFEYDEPEEEIEEPDVHEITITTDKKSYVTGETITINGTVTKFVDDNPDKPMGVMIFNPDGSIASITQLEIDKDGLFSDTIRIGGLIEQLGTYIIEAAYTPHERVETTFDVTLS